MRADETPGYEPQPLSASVSARVRSILAEAERSAGAIRADAERLAADRLRQAEDEARRLIEDARREADALLAARRRRLADLSGTIVSGAETVGADLESAGRARASLEELLRSLAQTADRLAAEEAGRSIPEPGAEPEPPVRLVPEPPVEERAEAPPSEGESDLPAGSLPPAERDGLTGPRLVAFQMAQAGSTRGEVAAHLRRTFAMQDPHEILNEVFAGRGPADA